MPIPTITGEFKVGSVPRYTVKDNGSQSCGLWLLSSDSKKNPDGTYTRTREFPIDGVIFGSLADYAGNLEKDCVVTVTGRIYLDEYQGVKRAKMFIDAIGKRSDPPKKKAAAEPTDDPWASAPSGSQYDDAAPPF